MNVCTVQYWVHYLGFLGSAMPKKRSQSDGDRGAYSTSDPLASGQGGRYPAQYSTFSADVCLPYACHRARPVPTRLRQCCSGRRTKQPVQQTPVVTQRCRTIHRRPAALGPHHQRSPVFTGWERPSVCSSSWRRSSITGWTARLHHTRLQTCNVCPTCRQDDVCGPHWHTNWMSPSRSANCWWPSLCRC